MSYLNLSQLNAIDHEVFNSRQPFPWVNPSGILLDDAYGRLVDTLPDVSTFTQSFGQRRKYGQEPHDRYLLEYQGQPALPDPWKEFLHELQQPTYREFLQRLFGVSRVALRFHWLYTPPGCAVSPHTDGKNELGTHLFYFNTAEEWDPAWGGATLILDDRGRLSPASNPSFDDFEAETPSNSIGNYSLLFRRTDHAWHGVRELRCPAGRLRKLFSVIVASDEPGKRLSRVWNRPRYRYF